MALPVSRALASARGDGSRVCLSLVLRIVPSTCPCVAAKAHQLFSIAALLAGGAPSVLVVLREEVQFLQPWKPLLMLPLRKRRAGLLNLARAAKDQQELRVGEFRAPAAGARKRNSYFFYPLCTHRKRKGCVLARLSLGWCVSIFPSLVPSLGFSVFFLSFWSFFFLSALITRSCSCSGRNPVLLPRPRATAHASFWFVLFIYYSR